MFMKLHNIVLKKKYPGSDVAHTMTGNCDEGFAKFTDVVDLEAKFVHCSIYREALKLEKMNVRLNKLLNC